VVVEVFVVVLGEGAAVVVDACTRVSAELSLALADGATGSAEEVVGFAWDSAARAGVGEPICASERVMAPSNAAVPQIKSLKRLNIGMNGKLKSAEAFKAGSRPAPGSSGRDILDWEELSRSSGTMTGMSVRALAPLRAPRPEKFQTAVARLISPNHRIFQGDLAKPTQSAG
jgi:hypothetical protein